MGDTYHNTILYLHSIIHTDFHARTLKTIVRSSHAIVCKTHIDGHRLDNSRMNDILLLVEGGRDEVEVTQRQLEDSRCYFHANFQWCE